MKYVDIDQTTGEVSWDRYFAHVRAMRGRIPDPLYAYASEWEYYSLNGINSLHDAWLIGVRFTIDPQEVTIEFLGARHDRRHLFRYTGVAAYSFDLDVRYTHGDRDVQAHEFRFDKAVLISHEFLFPNSRRIVVISESVLCSTLIGS